MSKKIEICELEEITSRIEDRNFFNVSKIEKIQLLNKLSEFIQGNDKILDTVEKPVLEKLYQAFITINRDRDVGIGNEAGLDLTIYQHCLHYIQCLHAYGDFFSSRTPTFLSCLRITLEKVEKLFFPLSIIDACSFMNMLSEHIRLLRGNHAVGVLSIFIVGVYHGLFDNVISVLVETVGCVPLVECPSSTFPQPPSESEKLLVTTSFEVLLSALKSLNGRGDVGDYDWRVSVLVGLCDQCFGRFTIAKHRKDVEEKERVK